MFEAHYSERSTASPEAVWELWRVVERWPDWNEQVERVEVDGDLLPGTEVRVKVRKGGTVRQRVTALDPGRLLITEVRFPGARQGHEHRVERRGRGCEIVHRIYVRGLMWPIFALLLGRKRMRNSIARFVERERELAE
jgi:uncharacterized protein YndB with AHSA1/START domain